MTAEAKRKAQKKKEKDRGIPSTAIYENEKLSDGGTTCIYKCPPKGRVESNSIGPGFNCPTMMNDEGIKATAS